MRGATETSSTENRDWSPTAIYSLGFLSLISVFNYLDRALLGLALPMIKEEMVVSDTVLGLISGLAFVLFYSLLGIPIAWAADRWNRRNIISIGFFFWSAMTVLTGFVGTIWQLAAARFLMGAGEAAGIAPSNSMISDIFRKARRPLAMAIFGTANSAAFIFLFPIAGWIAFNHGWRAMFIAAGIPGMILALIFFLTVKEPERGAREETIRKPIAPEGLLVTVRGLLKSRTYFFILIGVTFMGANVFAAASWTPMFLTRIHDLTISEVASSIGPVRGMLGAIGVLAGGIMIDRLSPKNLKWRIRLPAIACMLTGPAEAIFLLGDSKIIWLTGFGLTSFFTLIHQGPIYAAAINVSDIRSRALATAIIILCASLLGQAVGPFAVGFLNDVLAEQFGQTAIRYALLIIAVTPVLAGIFFWLAASSYETDIKKTGS